MNVREAKDFLVQETEKQASLEGISLSDLEKRMMYFTESGYVPEDPIQLNEEFEAQYETDEYENKISKLLHQAYWRAVKENDESRRRFDSAIKSLRRGDHYLLVMWDLPSDVRSALYSRPYVVGLFLGAFVLGSLYAVVRIAHRVTPPNPRIIQTVLVVLILLAVFFPRVVAKAFGWILENTVERLMGGNRSED